MKEEKRLDVIQRVYRSEQTMEKAGLVLGINERQYHRVKARVRRDAEQAVRHLREVNPVARCTNPR